jgi:predicted PurR-regulated permease PerM
MKKFIFLIALIFLSGCANFNPRNNPKIENKSGKIEDIRTNQNGIMAEIGKLRQEMEVNNSKLKEIQSGLVNINSAISRNENTGIQIIQGDGALIFVFAIVVIGMFLFYYRDRAIKSEKTSELMAREIARFNSPEFETEILSIAVEENRAKDIYELIKQRLQSN